MGERLVGIVMYFNNQAISFHGNRATAPAKE